LVALADRSNPAQEIFNPSLDFFEDVADKQPLFKAWRDDFFNTKLKSPDGTKHKVFQLALDEARDPMQAGNEQTNLLAIELAQVMANAALAKCHDKKLAFSSWLTSQDGENLMAKRTAEHEATKARARPTTALRVGRRLPRSECESASVTRSNPPIALCAGNCGTYDMMQGTFGKIAVQNVSGMAQQV
jgi:hypothetical protein